MLYYDNTNNLYLRKYYSFSLQNEAIGIIRLENGKKTEYNDTRIPVKKGAPIWMRIVINGRKTFFQWCYDGCSWINIGKVFDSSTFSDEYCQFGEFTGTMAGLFCRDSYKHEHSADFDLFQVEAE